MKPSIALSNPEEQCLTFYFDSMPGTYIGYRFIEGDPSTSDKPVLSYDQKPSAKNAEMPRRSTPLVEIPVSPAWQAGWRFAYQEQDPQALVQLSFQLMRDGSAHTFSIEQEGKLQREMHLQPFSQGVRMWLKLTTQEDILRETISRKLAPASYWDRVAPHATWEQITCGMAWEHTAYISNRHPADCLHSYIDFGPLQAGESRTLQGVVYCIEGSKDDLLAIYQKERYDGKA